MSFDNSRFIFDPFDNYASVVMPQGRVQLDADWNEFLAEIARRIQAGTLDIMGRAVYPETTPNAFYISASPTPWVVDIGQGRMYVDGLLAENHGPRPGKWDPALAELSGAPQPPNPTTPSPTPSIAFTAQPYFPGATPPPSTAAGSYLFYLDVWTRAVTWLMDPEIVDSAVGVDTSGRLQTVWQVRWMPATTGTTTYTCGTPDASIVYPVASAGQLSTGLVPNTLSGDCCLTSNTGYTGLENQFYRVEIHQGGPLGKATFKWSRENASVITSVIDISQGNLNGTPVTILNVTSLGRDQVLNFKNGDWIELLDDDIELNGKPDPNYPLTKPIPFGSPGILCQIASVDPTTNTIYIAPQLTSPPTADPKLHTRILRWDQAGQVYSTDTNGNLTPYFDVDGSTGDIPVALSGTAVTLELEYGVTVTFSVATSGGDFLSGDFWTFAARTDGTLDPPAFTNAPPRGIHHHYTKLSVVAFDATGKAINTPDCRTPFGCNCEGDCGCCTVTVGDNVTSFGQFLSIQQAIDSLPTTGGEVCILPGKYYEYVVISDSSEITLRGSGPETILYAYSADPGGTADQSGSGATVTSDSGLSGIITIANSQHIELTNFTIEAPDNWACILLDQISASAQEEVFIAKKSTLQKRKEQLAKEYQFSGGRPPQVINVPGEYIKAGNQYIPDNPHQYGIAAGYFFPQIVASDTDVSLNNLYLTASTSPAIAAVEAALLTICDNRIFMKDVAGSWPAIYISGADITLERNWIGLQDNTDAANYATEAILADLPANFKPSTAAPVANGGIQIGGYSSRVSILENTIERGAFNAISLGGILLNNGTTPVPGLNGLFFTAPSASAGATLFLPAVQGNNQLAADGPLQDIRIERNRISTFGLCGIGPVGFFTSTQTPEIVSVANLSILGNTIAGTLQATLLPIPTSVTGHGYGAICLPDLQNLVARDNTVTDFGSQPGAQVCGIFLLNAEQAEFSRNQIVETRDWTGIPSDPPANINGAQAGIGIAMVSPPALDQTATAAAWTGASAQGVPAAGGPPIYQPGLPAIRLEQNVVRVPLNYSLAVLGYGPFSITGNHLTSGGTVPGGIGGLALSILILNLGLATEFDTPTSFTTLWTSLNNPPTLQASDNALSNSSSGMVLFTDNICQLENRAAGATGLSSIFIGSLDHITFADNHTWMDGVGVQLGQSGLFAAAFTDALLFAITIQVSSNRLQESPGAVLFSALTAGLLNITAQNISTFCIYTVPLSAAINNISYAGSLKKCESFTRILGESIANSLSAAPPPPPPPSYSYGVATGPADFGEKMSIAVSHTDQTSINRVQQLSVVHEARLAQYTRIATTVTAQSGATSPQAVKATAAVTASNATIARVAMIKRQVSAQAPAVPATGWGIYGNVYNSSSKPVSAYSVYFVDSTNTYQNAFGIAYTAADGSFQFVYQGPPAGQTAPTTELFLQVGNASGDPVYTSKTAFTPTTGAAQYQIVTLPAGEKPLGILPKVLRTITLPAVENTPAKPAPKEPAPKPPENKG